MGIEPMSTLLKTTSATCLVPDYTRATPHRHSIIAQGVFVVLLRVTKKRKSCPGVLSLLIRISQTDRHVQLTRKYKTWLIFYALRISVLSIYCFDQLFYEHLVNARHALKATNNVSKPLRPLIFIGMTFEYFKSLYSNCKYKIGFCQVFD